MIENGEMLGLSVDDKEAVVSGAAVQDETGDDKRSLPQVAMQTILSIRDRQATLMRQNQVVANVTKAEEESVAITSDGGKALDWNESPSSSYCKKAKTAVNKTSEYSDNKNAIAESDSLPAAHSESEINDNKPTLCKRKYTIARMVAGKRSCPQPAIASKCKWIVVDGVSDRRKEAK
jgi:hypothetical protein